MTHISKFRSTKMWQDVRSQAVQRDMCLCRVCLDEGRYNGKDIQVHHIVPMAVDWNKRIDLDNLITLCPAHHELAECGEIPAERLRRIIGAAEI